VQTNLAWTNPRLLRLQTETAEGCMIKPIDDFVSRLGTNVSLDETFIVNKQGRYFLLYENFKRLALNDFFYAGTYMGKAEDGKFFPSLNLLGIIAQKKANKVFVDKKTEWLFICGRDIFKQGITNLTGSTKKGDYVLVLNAYGECLGFGKILRDLDGKRAGLAVENILDIGDFLRREK
jgi:ribosome biogenesis protein Nip4